MSCAFGQNDFAPSGSTSQEIPSIEPSAVPGKPCPVSVLHSSDNPTTGTAAAVNSGGILYEISSYFAMNFSGVKSSAPAARGATARFVRVARAPDRVDARFDRAKCDFCVIATPRCAIIVVDRARRASRVFTRVERFASGSRACARA